MIKYIFVLLFFNCIFASDTVSKDTSVQFVKLEIEEARLVAYQVAEVFENELNTKQKSLYVDYTKPNKIDSVFESIYDGEEEFEDAKRRFFQEYKKVCREFNVDCTKIKVNFKKTKIKLHL